MRCVRAIESYGSGWFQNALTATESTTFGRNSRELPVLQTRICLSLPLGAEFAEQTTLGTLPFAISQMSFFAPYDMNLLAIAAVTAMALLAAGTR